MPFSDPCFDAEIEAFLRSVRPRVLVDIGPGAGKYGHLARAASSNTRTIAVEVEPAYIAEFRLAEVYSEVVCADAAIYFLTNVDFSADVVIFGDSLEHFRRSVGLDLIHYFMYRCKYLIVIFPSKYVQYSWRGYAAEAHVSVWDVEDFRPFGIHRHQRVGFMHLVIVQGYLADSDAVFPMA